jgi:hypothetical protein
LQFVCSVEQAWGMGRKELLMSAAPMIKDAEGRKLQQYLQAATEAQQQLRAQAQQQLADVQQQLTLTVAAITQQVGLQFRAMEEELVDTRAKHRKEMVERKRLHNQLLELRGNIRVFCRVRPLNSREKESCVTFPEEANICIDQVQHSTPKNKTLNPYQTNHQLVPTHAAGAGQRRQGVPVRPRVRARINAGRGAAAAALPRYRSGVL